jgi:hypothetical protein
MTMRGYSVAVVRSFTDTDGQITGAGADLPFTATVDEGFAFAESSAAGNAEFIQLLLSNGVTVEFKKKTKVIDGVTGAEKAGGAGASGDEANFTFAETSGSVMTSIAALRGKPLLVGISLGEAVLPAEESFAYLLGKITGKIERGTKGEEVVTVKLSFVGEATTADATGDTAIKAVFTAITPIGGSAITFPPLVTGDLATLKAGSLVIKAAP